MIKIIASGSSGNCYLLDRIIIECGIPFKKLQKAVNYELKGVEWCLVTHGHL